MNFILENITVEYLKNKLTDEEIFLREKGSTLPEPEWIAEYIATGNFEIIEREEETFHDPIIKYAVPRSNYKEPRRYDALYKQLDDLWHDINDGFFGENAKNGTWYSKIKDLKDKFPKPTS